MNIDAAERLEREHGPLDVMLIESGGDNLAATFSTDLVDHWLYVIDVAAGDDIPRKRGLGHRPGRPARRQQDRPRAARRRRPRAHAPATSQRARPERPTVYTDLRSGGAEVVLEHLEHAVLFSRV